MHSPFLPSVDNYFPESGKMVQAPAIQAAPRIEPLPETEWPWQVKLIALLRHPADIGLGDTFERAIIGKRLSAWFKATFELAIGKPCGCANRQRHLNSRFPYHRSAPAAPLPPSQTSH